MRFNLTNKRLGQRFGVFIVNFKNISHIVLAAPLFPGLFHFFYLQAANESIKGKIRTLNT